MGKTRKKRCVFPVQAIVRGGHFWRGQGTQWYFPRPRDLFEHNTFLMLSDSMDRSAGIGFRCAATFRSPGGDAGADAAAAGARSAV